MTRTRVKICGITNSSDLQTAVDNGADALGFIVGVPESPRNLPVREAWELIKETPVFVEAVAVTVPRDMAQLEGLYRKLSPDHIQVHGINHFQLTRESLPGAKIIGAIPAGSGHGKAKEQARRFDAVLVDTQVPGKHGGTGRTHDWSQSRQLRDAIHPKPLILAGGLTPGNVVEAIQTVNPYAVDVSSGVEATPGVKDPEKVSFFMRKVREADSK